ncbi:hypothetical protein SG34_018925 [Thalassomonas viridans]|uniref:HEAT repeat domain-containing protein n=1 Tax=Thalassomonas viridans TaxID=137584 RepID=A0AAE9YZS6_9GAMM|nr:hypothetical protein [Thalassomonas viridans]WDE03455.1 hypothetical protein SG34_018925 [Thalassomonas viridans]
MNDVVLPILAMSAIIITLVLLLLWFRKRRSMDDQLNIHSTTPFAFKGVAPALAAQIREAVNSMGAVGTDAESRYQNSLKPLAADASKVIQAIDDELAILPLAHYLDRWALIQLLAELKQPASLPLLDKLLSNKMPPEQHLYPHARSSLRQETINLTTAVEAIARIAATGDQAAIKLLFKHAEHPSLSVRRACVQEYLKQGGKNAREQLLDILSEREHHLLDIRKIKVEDIPAIHINAGEIPARSEKEQATPPHVTPQRGL